MKHLPDVLIKRPLVFNTPQKAQASSRKQCSMQKCFTSAKWISGGTSREQTGRSTVRRVRTNMYLFPTLKPPPTRALFQDLALILRVFTTFPRWLVLWVRTGAAPGHHTSLWLVRGAAATSRPNSLVTVSSVPV